MASKKKLRKRIKKLQKKNADLKASLGYLDEACDLSHARCERLQAELASYGEYVPCEPIVDEVPAPDVNAPFSHIELEDLPKRKPSPLSGDSEPMVSWFEND